MSDKTELYPPLEESGQPAFYHEPYASSTRRSPTRPRYNLPRTASELTGPVFSQNKVEDWEKNLFENRDGTRALGSPINIGGRLLDEAGRPVADTLIELWQANAAGRYDHPLDDRDVPLDPNFTGCGRVVTDSEGKYAFTTIIPGPYPVPRTGNWWRPPHIHFSIFGPSFMTRLITQMYFPGHDLNAIDAILHGIPDKKAVERLISTPTPELGKYEYSLGYTFDITIRGRNATPMTG